MGELLVSYPNVSYPEDIFDEYYDRFWESFVSDCTGLCEGSIYLSPNASSPIPEWYILMPTSCAECQEYVEIYDDVEDYAQNYSLQIKILVQ